MNPVTFSPKFRSETIEGFLEEQQRVQRIESMMSGARPGAWQDINRRRMGLPTQQEWDAFERPDLGKRPDGSFMTNWDLWASDQAREAPGGQGRYTIDPVNRSIYDRHRGQAPDQKAQPLGALGGMAGAKRRKGSTGGGHGGHVVMPGGGGQYKRGAFRGFTAFGGGGQGGR